MSRSSGSTRRSPPIGIEPGRGPTVLCVPHQAPPVWLAMEKSGPGHSVFVGGECC
jgi:hypothetical protein